MIVPPAILRESSGASSGQPERSAREPNDPIRAASSLVKPSCDPADRETSATETLLRTGDPAVYGRICRLL